MNNLPLELIYESFQYIEKNHFITCSSITKLLNVLRKLIHVQICSHETSIIYGNFVSLKHTIVNSFYLYNYIHHKIYIKQPISPQLKIYLNNDRLRHISFHYFYENEYHPHNMIIFPKKLKSLIHIENLNPLEIKTSHLEYLSCDTITNETSHLFPKLKYLVIQKLPDKLPLSLQVLYLSNSHLTSHNSHLTSHIDISYLVNVTKLLLEKKLVITYPPHLKYLKIKTVSSYTTLELPNSLESLIVKKQPQPITQELILHFPQLLTKIKVQYLYFKTYRAKQNFINSNLKTIIVTGSDHTKIPGLPKKLETLITLNLTIPNPLPKSLRTLGEYLTDVSTIKKSQITHLKIRIYPSSITDFSNMKLQRLRVFSNVGGLVDYTIILPSSLQILSLHHIASSIKIVDNECKLTHLRYHNNDSISIMGDDTSDLLNLLKIPSLKWTYYNGNYDINLSFSPNLEYFELLIEKPHIYLITKELFPKLKKLSLPYVINELRKMTFPKSLHTIQINANASYFVPESIKYIIIF